MLEVPKGSKVYISGPIDSDPNFVASFAAAERMLIEQGYEVLSPVTDPEKNGLELPRSTHMSLDYSAVLKADAIYLLRGFHKSPGAQDEIRCALNCSKPIFYEQGI